MIITFGSWALSTTNEHGLPWVQPIAVATCGSVAYHALPVALASYYDDQGQDAARHLGRFTGMLNLDARPNGMRVIVRKERPHPGAQLRFTDIDGHRFTCFVTGTRTGQLADLELRHRRRARCDRICCAKDTGLANLPLHDST
jgi:hypothetical protein